jgi:tether containing UBX domain for GLUT4
MKVFKINTDEFKNNIRETTLEEEKESHNLEEQDFYKYAMSLIKSNNDKFVVKRKADYEKLIKKPLYTKATIRIKFPNDRLLQGNFGLMETVGDIYDFVKENLTEEFQPFSLFTAYPRKIYTDKNATIYNQSLAPSTELYITFPNIDPKNSYKYLKSE